MNGYTKTGFLVTKVFGCFLATICFLGLALSLAMIILFCFERVLALVIIFLFLSAFCLFAFFFMTKYFFVTYTMDSKGILIKDGFKRELRFIGWEECNYIRIAYTTLFGPRSGRIPDAWPRYPYFVFSKEPVDVYCKNTKGEKKENTYYWYALVKLKSVMIPMTPQNVEYVQKFFDIDHLLQAETLENCYDWQDPKTWGKDQ